MSVSIKFGSVFFLAALLFSFSSCYYDKEQLLYHGSNTIDCTTISAKFATDVKPIIQNKCATSGCHNAASSAGGSVLETYAQISGTAARINQRCIVAKDMPPGSPLTNAEIAVLKCWLDSGALNN